MIGTQAQRGTARVPREPNREAPRSRPARTWALLRTRLRTWKAAGVWRSALSLGGPARSPWQQVSSHFLRSKSRLCHKSGQRPGCRGTTSTLQAVPPHSRSPDSQGGPHTPGDVLNTQTSLPLTGPCRDPTRARGTQDPPSSPPRLLTSNQR